MIFIIMILLVVAVFFAWIAGNDDLTAILGFPLIVSGMALMICSAVYFTVERYELDERFVVTQSEPIRSVEYSPLTDEYLVTYGTDGSKGVQTTNKITNGETKELLTGYQSERPWVLYPWMASTEHADIFVFPLSEIELIK